MVVKVEVYFPDEVKYADRPARVAEALEDAVESFRGMGVVYSMDMWIRTMKDRGFPDTILKVSARKGEQR